MQFENTLEFARYLDDQDPLTGLREAFYIPILNGKEVIYLAAHSLGLQPKTAQDQVLDELESWATFGADGFTMGSRPWKDAGNGLLQVLSTLTGAAAEDIFITHGLAEPVGSVLARYHKPGKKILIQQGVFSSAITDLTAFFTSHNVGAEEVIWVKAAAEEDAMQNEDVLLRKLKELGEQVSVVAVASSDEETGRAPYIRSLARVAADSGAAILLDASNTVGVSPLQLAEWDIDFAGWTSGKFLNSGPNGPAGFFVNPKHAGKISRHEAPGILGLAAHTAALEIIEKAGVQRVVEKAEKLSQYLVHLLIDLQKKGGQVPQIRTPVTVAQRGAMIALSGKIKARHYYEVLKNNGVIAVWRDPDIIQIAPSPMYTTFEELFYFGKIFEHAIHIG